TNYDNRALSNGLVLLLILGISTELLKDKTEITITVFLGIQLLIRIIASQYAWRVARNLNRDKKNHAILAFAFPVLTLTVLGFSKVKRK
ncbi:MAG: hypothetical protein VXY56_04745, partial [Pseudomonadota bacterium]|nr:hypothetical protein [Pseudomonadota bacterium]